MAGPIPSVNVAVSNDAGELLLIRRTDNDNWALPGGGIDIGESLTQAAVRETREESGIECEITGLSGIYSDPGHVILGSSETSEARWVRPDEATAYQMDQSMRQRVRYLLEASTGPYIG